MNVIFLDFDGVIDTHYYQTNEMIEKKIQIVAEIAKEYNCKIVLECAAKNAMDEETLEIDSDWVKFVVDTLNKYGIEVIGRTPNVEKKKTEYSGWSMWKEDEIRLYLIRHPEIEHFCVIDDDDLPYYAGGLSDLDKVREYLVRTKEFDRENPESEGILPEHKEEVGKILKKENKFNKRPYRKDTNN